MRKYFPIYKENFISFLIRVAWGKLYMYDYKDKKMVS